jgi:hypothetical protein
MLALNSPRILERSPANTEAFSLSESSSLDAPLQLAVQHVGLAAQIEQLPLQGIDLALEILLAALDDDGRPDVGEHQQQDDGAEPAADAVEERQVKTSNSRRLCMVLKASRAKG